MFELEFVLVMPEQDAVVATTADTGKMQDELNAIWDKPFASFTHKALPENPAAQDKVKQLVAALESHPKKLLAMVSVSASIEESADDRLGVTTSLPIRHFHDAQSLVLSSTISSDPFPSPGDTRDDGVARLVLRGSRHPPLGCKIKSGTAPHAGPPISPAAAISHLPVKYQKLPHPACIAIDGVLRHMPAFANIPQAIQKFHIPLT